MNAASAAAPRAPEISALHARATSTRCAVALALALAACSGGGSKSSGTPGGGGPSTVRVTNVSATAGDGQVTLTWSPVSGALSYNLYWATTPGVTLANGDLIPDVASPQALTVANGVTYYAVITAVLSTGETAPSAEVSFTATAAVPQGPVRVTGVTAVAGEASATVTWDALAGALSYNLYWSTTPGVTPANGNLLSGVTSPLALNATNDVTFYVVVTAVLSTGETEPSVEVSFTPSAATPPPPQTSGGHVGTVTTIAGDGSMGYVDGAAIHAEFLEPTGIVAVGTSSLYVCDTSNMLIRKVDLAAHTVSTVAGYTSTYAGHLDGVGTAAGFDSPRGITSDGTYLYVADTKNHLIRRIELATSRVTTIAGVYATWGANDGPGASATFYYPRGVATDGTTLWVADTYNNAIRAIDLASGTVSTIAGDPLSYGGNVDGVGAAARFNLPVALALWNGWLLVADNGNSALRAIDLATDEVVTVSTATTAPAGVAVIGDYAYVTNAAAGGGGDPVPGTGNTITEIDLVTGDAWVLAGGDWYDQWKDGTGTAAALNIPVGITAIGGTLYFTDSLTHIVRRVDLQPL